MTAKTLRMVRAQPKPPIPRAMLKKAVSLFRSSFVPRSVRRANARKWLRAMEQLGDKHIYRGGAVTWGARQRQEKTK
jgi:hypothetical protein